jgi:TolB protein
VQSNGQTHHLGMVTSAGQVLNYELHLHAAAPAWSPDGTKIAFFGEPGISTLGGIYELGTGVWIIDDQGKNSTQIVQIDHVKNIAWSPDGTKLAFEFGQPGMTHEIRVVDSRDGQQISNFSGEQPGWSPDSQKLGIKACLPDCGLWQVNFDGSGRQQITFHKTDSYPAWSPDDQYLAFTSEQDGDWEVYLIRLADGDLQPLTDRPGTDTTPVFGPDSQEVYLRTDAFGGWRITVMTLDGRNERLVKEGVGPSDDWGLARPAVH